MIKFKIIIFNKYLILTILSFVLFNCNGRISHNVVKSENGYIKNIDISKNSSITQKIQFLESGNIDSRIFYQNGKKIATWKSKELFNEYNLIKDYYSNGILKSKGYKDDNNQLHGHWSYYDRNGELESDRYYFHGEPDGDWYSYHHDNKDNIIHHDYIKGNGTWKEFYNRKVDISNKTNKEKNTPYYNDVIIVIEESSFKNKKLHGEYIYRYKDGKIKVIGNYDNGKKNGEWNHYNNLGKIIKIENYDSGLLHGNIKHYFNDGKSIKIIGQYKNNKKFGDWFWYFDTDRKSSYRKHYSN